MGEDGCGGSIRAKGFDRTGRRIVEGERQRVVCSQQYKRREGLPTRKWRIHLSHLRGQVRGGGRLDV